MIIKTRNIRTHFPPQRVLQVVALSVQAPELFLLGAGASLGTGRGQDGVLGGEGSQPKARLVRGQGKSLRQVLAEKQCLDFVFDISHSSCDDKQIENVKDGVSGC